MIAMSSKVTSRSMSIGVHKLSFLISFTGNYVLHLLLASTYLSDLIPSFWLGMIMTICRSAIYIALFLDVLCGKKMSVKQFVGLLIGFIIFMLSAYSCDNTILVEGAILVYCSRNIDIDKWNSYIIKLLIVTIVIISTMSLIGLISSRVKINGESQYRYSLGFSHPNTFGLLGFELLCLFLYGYRKTIGFKHYVLALLLTFGVYYICRSVTAMVCSLLVIAGCYLFKQVLVNGLKPNSRIIRRVFVFVLVTSILIISYVVYYIWNNPDAIRYSSFAIRFTLAQRYINSYGIGLLGHSIVTGRHVALPGYRAMYSYLDNGYIWLLVRYGILASSIIVIFLYQGIRALIHQRKYIMLIVVFVYLIYALSETTVFRIPMNCFFMYLASIIRQEKMEKVA